MAWHESLGALWRFGLDVSEQGLDLRLNYTIQARSNRVHHVNTPLAHHRIASQRSLPTSFGHLETAILIQAIVKQSTSPLWVTRPVMSAE